MNGWHNVEVILWWIKPLKQNVFCYLGATYAIEGIEEKESNEIISICR